MPIAKAAIAAFALSCVSLASAKDYFVDAVNGNDAWDGTTSVVPDGSQGTAGPKRTLKAVFEDCKPASSDVVNAAKGTYGAESMDGYRVRIPAGVTLVGDGAEETIILGQADADGTNGCGADALRCVYLGRGAKLLRFTLTNGHVPAWDSGTANFGGAVNCADAAKATIADCIVTNNVSGRAAVNGGCAIRCRFEGNKACATVADLIFGSAYGCVFGDPGGDDLSCGYQTGPYVNCTFFGDAGYSVRGADANRPSLKNCLVLKRVHEYVNLSNCWYTSSIGSNVAMDGKTRKVTADELNLSSGFIPTRISPSVNAGVNGYYDLDPEFGNGDIAGNVRIQEDVIDLGAYEVSSQPLHWYVDAENGNDANDGLSSATARRTLAVALAEPELMTGDVVHAAPGVYSDGVMTASGLVSGFTDRFRAIVPVGVTLVADAGPEQTIILGEADTDAATGTWSCGPNAVSCVKLLRGATVSGFTLTGGHTRGFDGNHWGGAVLSATAANAPVMESYVVGCIVTNNYAARGAGLFGGTAIGCRFADNRVAATGTDIMQGAAYNCLFGDIQDVSQFNVYQGGPYVNCTFYGSGLCCHYAGSGLFDGIRNSLVLKPSKSSVQLVNCLTIPFTSSTSGWDDDSIAMPIDEMALDGFVPTALSPACDNAKASEYYASFALAHPEVASVDVRGGQRIYNGGIDIGACEFDCREVFAKTLKKSRLVVTSAAPEVTLGENAVLVPAGDGLALEWELPSEATCTFTVAVQGEGAATVLVDGIVIEPVAGGRYSLHCAAGTHNVSISFTGTGVAVASAFRSNVGFELIVR